MNDDHLQQKPAAPAERPDAESTGLDRRAFLKSAAAAGAGLAATGLSVAARGADENPGERNASVAKKPKPLPGDIVIGRPGSDFMVDVIKTLNLDYVSANPGSSFRSLHESVVNYGGNRQPELLTCMHLSLIHI